MSLLWGLPRSAIRGVLNGLDAQELQRPSLGAATATDLEAFFASKLKAKLELQAAKGLQASWAAAGRRAAPHCLLLAAAMEASKEPRLAVCHTDRRAAARAAADLLHYSTGGHCWPATPAALICCPPAALRWALSSSCAPSWAASRTRRGEQRAACLCVASLPL